MEKTSRISQRTICVMIITNSGKKALLISHLFLDLIFKNTKLFFYWLMRFVLSKRHIIFKTKRYWRKQPIPIRRNKSSTDYYGAIQNAVSVQFIFDFCFDRTNKWCVPSTRIICIKNSFMVFCCLFIVIVVMSFVYFVFIMTIIFHSCTNI